jgi:hypothetical protein
MNVRNSWFITVCFSHNESAAPFNFRENHMGTKTYTGFNADQEQAMRQVVSNAGTALSKAYAAMIKNTDTASFTTWFGTGNRASVQRIVQLMNYAMINGVVNISYTAGGHCANGTTNAVAYAPNGVWVQPDISGAGSKVADFNMDVCPRFLKIMALLGSENQSQVGTFLHELSHLVGNTNDEVYPGGAVAYGATAAKRLAKDYPATAINNAENYGFYISSFLN